MKVSLNIVKSFIETELPAVDELVQRINERLGGVENIIDLNAKYKDAKIVRVVECEKHPDADKLSLCQVDAGTGELVQVVCGAPNVHADMWAVWLPPESIVPATFDDAEPFVLGARELRGKMSNGMLASARELAIGDDHNGIIDIADSDIPSGAELVAGASFAKVFGLDDTIIEIENKMFTHRPDCFGQLGVAREISAILQEDQPRDTTPDNRFSNPDWYWSYPEFSDATGLELEVFNDTPDMSSRFMAVAIKDAKVVESPLWLKCQLVAMGAKPINNIVDLTNYIMLISAQPTHAYDYDKLRGHKIGVRLANAGEKITLLNEKTYELTEDDIVIADGEGAIGLAGVMGGFDSEVTNDTRNIVLEVANFDMYAIRKTSMRHGLFTDAVTRFNKGQSPLQQNRIVKRLLELMPGSQASPVADLPDKSNHLTQESVHPSLLVSSDFINERLGTDFTDLQIGNILRFANFATYPSEEDSSKLSITAPFWRTDIELPEDVVEEVGRLYGFDRLPRILPTRSTAPVPKNASRKIKQLVRQSLSRAGANEALTYSFVHENILKRAEQDVSQAFRLSNALSPDLQYYRLSVLPSLLDKVHANIKAGHDEFVLFEIGKGHNKKYHLDDDEGLPREMDFIDAVYASKNPSEGAAYYHMRRLVEQLGSDLGIKLVCKPITESMDYPVTAPFDLDRSALVETGGGVFIGMIGELKQAVIKGFKLPEYVAAATIDTVGLQEAHSKAGQNYQPLSRFPKISQDISLTMPSDARFADIMEKVKACTEIDELDIKVEPITIYQSPDDSSSKTITLRLSFVSQEKTLSDADIRPIMEKIEVRIQNSDYRL